jgi:hypothetical protein
MKESILDKIQIAINSVGLYALIITIMGWVNPLNILVSFIPLVIIQIWVSFKRINQFNDYKQ